MPSLTSTLVEVRRRIQRQGGRPMNEENTKATLIEPVLCSLGWDVEDVDAEQVVGDAVPVGEVELSDRDAPGGLRVGLLARSCTSQPVACKLVSMLLAGELFGGAQKARGERLAVCDLFEADRSVAC